MSSRGRAYYNENDAFAAQWIRNLISAGLVSAGDVDERDIRDVHAADLDGYSRCHFFSGIAVWDHALGLAGWPDDGRTVWTGSCPCQPFSAAGRRRGVDDERHLWPVWFDLIRQCKPAIVLGEQVEAAVRLGWLDAVFSDLEGEGYACGAVVLGAHSVGAPHIRQRLWFVADAAGERWDGSQFAGAPGAASAGGAEAAERWTARVRQSPGCVATRELGDTSEPRGRWDAGAVPCSQGTSAGEWGGTRHQPDEPVSASAIGVAQGDAISPRLEGGDARALGDKRASAQRAGAISSWSELEWLPCRDGKARPTQPGLQPLAHGAASRVGRLRAYGNAIVAPVAAEFIRAVLDCQPEKLNA
ncbi:DNA cytosine methyltransferase [Methylobacterium indicum]|uniref:DNA cytosine methyltransferase n=1 Tax=Methylobacterium indicum TaxID=1775910 RepID=UPI0009E43505|nr:DNA cytosine methyltransferase [Methylobacterium indicum]